MPAPVIAPVTASKAESLYAWYVVALLAICYLVSIIDRFVLSLLIVPIQGELAISDTQMGFMVGIAFGVFFSLMGLPMGRLADNWSRTKIITIGLATWGLMTVATGLATNYWQLFVARMGVGIGEAALAPAAWSLISDYFQEDRRARALSVFQIGGYSGSGLGYLVSALVLGSLSTDGATTGLPFIGHMQPWRQVLLIVGLPTVLLILPVLTIREPARTDLVEKMPAGHRRDGSISALLRILGSRWKTYCTFYVAMGFVLMTLMTAATWAPTFLIREHHVTVEHAGYTYGFITLLVAVPGVYFGGWLADKLSNGGVRNAYLKTIAGATIAMMPCIIAAPLFSSYSAAAAGFALFLFFNGATNGVAVTYIQSITPAHVRSQVSALYLLSINLIGFCGPTLLPLLARTVTESGKSIGTPLSLLAGAASLGAVLIFLLNWRAFDAAQAEQ